jgi:peptide/nickel transport system permease protein
MKLSILLTDWLIYLLLVTTCVFIWIVRRHEHLRAPWRKVFQSTSGMVSLTVLSLFVVVGLLDSLHFRPRLPAPEGQPAQYSVEALSVLDWLATPLRAHLERTYSAPFATHSYAKETVTLPDGKEAREFPRLKFGGAHLSDPQNDRLPDIGARISLASAIAIVIWLFLAAVLGQLLAWREDVSFTESQRRIWHGETAVPWRAVLITVAVLVLLIVPALMLSPYYHILGTSKVGQDVFYQAIKSIRTGLVIGTLTTLITLPFALLLGIMAGYFRGLIDDVIQYTYTVLNSIPGVLLIAAAVLMTQVYMDTHPELFPTINERADLRLLFLCIILGITSWTGLCRLLRGETLKLREMEYIQSAHALGVSDFRILLRHVLPNVMHIVLIAVVLDFSGLVLAEAVLSYVGVGVDPSMVSFGTMINSARLEMAREPMVWWSLAAAFGFMFTLVLFANLFADAVRDAFDPRARQKFMTMQFLTKYLPPRRTHDASVA